ncbi:MAG: hypothetical protein M1819_002916 [Sarea resinae]|nr:MAG: hypothetical protein M1819_002916 [Sarea resinae]
MPPQPALPEPVQADPDSMLRRKFGKEVANYYAGMSRTIPLFSPFRSPLNRVAFLRADHPFLSAAVQHPSTSFLLVKNLAPLSKDPTKLAYASYKDVKPLIGEDPFSKSEEELIREFNSSATIPQLLFLGLDERDPHSFAWNDYKGAPFFALDVTPKGSTEAQAKGVIAEMEARGMSFLEGRTHMYLNAHEAAIYAQARAILDWNFRNPFCAQCGQPTLSIHAGMKRICPPTDLASLSSPITGSTTATQPTPTRGSCATRKGVSNLSFPRTDPTIIVAVVSHDSQRLLLGRSKRFPPLFYSTLAGFVEPAESVEEAVRREVWEESGVSLGRVVIHSTQPWPYPANLMIGAIAQSVPGGEEIHLKHDPELEDAKWVSVDEVREALRIGTSGLGEEPKKEWKEGGLRFPPETAIANQLMTAVVEGGFMDLTPKI